LLTELAGIKLTKGEFDPENVDHVCAVLSQRICIDTVMVGSEALQLADRSVANHMRLLIGISHNQRTFQTLAPSEPMLALGAARLLYTEKTVLGKVLHTFSHKLCEAGLVDKGLLGELAARTLLTVARDLAAPQKSTSSGRDLREPIPLIGYLDKLFGNNTWCGTHRNDFNKAFEDTYVNFSHWIVTKDLLPQEPSQCVYHFWWQYPLAYALLPRQLLANLWARGAALQCYFQQESLNFLIVTYKGDITADTIFDIENLSAVVVQVKYKVNADTQAGHELRPIVIPRNIHQPLPYIALLMELGTKSNHHETKSQITVSASPLKDDVVFGSLWEERDSAVKNLNEYKANKKAKAKTKMKMTIKGRAQDARQTGLEEEVKDAQAKIDAVNRFSIFVRGASSKVYGVLDEADIVKEFAHLLNVTMPLPTTPQDTTMKQMHPLEHMDQTSDHTAWMFLYGRDEDGEGEGEDEEEDGEGETSMDWMS